MKKPLHPCGTDGAYQRHIHHDETPCQPCQDAHTARRAAYTAKYRAAMTRRPPNVRALERLRQHHATEYDQYLAEEIRAAEITRSRRDEGRRRRRQWTLRRTTG